MIHPPRGAADRPAAHPSSPSASSSFHRARDEAGPGRVLNMASAGSAETFSSHRPPALETGRRSPSQDDGTCYEDDGCYYTRDSQRQSADTLWVLAQILLMGLVCAGAWAITVRIVECLS